MVTEHLGDRLGRLRRLADLTQEALAERSGVSVDVVRKLEQKRKHSARLPTLHALSRGLGVELTALLGDPPGVPSTGEADPPRLVALRRAIMPPLFAPPPEPNGPGRLTALLLRREISDSWTLHHEADFGRLMDVLPGIITDARFASAVGDVDERAAGQAALGKALQLAGHLAIRLGKIDLALSALERAMNAALESGDAGERDCRILLWDGKESFASVCCDGWDEADSVLQQGPRSLWNAVLAARSRWEERGCPGITRYTG